MKRKRDFDDNIFIDCDNITDTFEPTSLRYLQILPTSVSNVENHLKEFFESGEDIVDEEETVLSEEETVLSEEETVLSEEETVLSEEETVLSEEETVLSEEKKVASEEKKVIPKTNPDALNSKDLFIGENTIITNSEIALRLVSCCSTTPFLIQLWKIIENLENSKYIKWNSNGTRFEISEQIKKSVIFGKYFRHNNFTSFQRQLNYFGFKKVEKKDSSVVYYHKDFCKYFPQNVRLIKRKTNSGGTKGHHTRKKCLPNILTVINNDAKTPSLNRYSKKRST
jgi:hypothetical protein